MNMNIWRNFQICISVPLNNCEKCFLSHIKKLFSFSRYSNSNLADDSTIYVGSKDLTELLEILRKECETAINWFKTNKMIVNPDKF